VINSIQFNPIGQEKFDEESYHIPRSDFKTGNREDRQREMSLEHEAKLTTCTEVCHPRSQCPPGCKTGQRPVDANGKPLECRLRGRSTGSKLPERQLPESERPAGDDRHSWSGVAYTHVVTDGVTKYKCNYCDKTASKTNTMWAHCQLHFPPTWWCEGCDELFHLRTTFNQHFLKECECCGKKYQKSSLSAHMKVCRHADLYMDADGTVGGSAAAVTHEETSDTSELAASESPIRTPIRRPTHPPPPPPVATEETSPPTRVRIRINRKATGAERERHRSAGAHSMKLHHAALLHRAVRHAAALDATLLKSLSTRAARMTARMTTKLEEARAHLAEGKMLLRNDDIEGAWAAWRSAAVAVKAALRVTVREKGGAAALIRGGSRNLDSFGLTLAKPPRRVRVRKNNGTAVCVAVVTAEDAADARQRAAEARGDVIDLTGEM
jgi:hypothetical protein